MKYEKPELQVEVFDNSIYTTGGTLIESSSEGGVDPWPFGETQTTGDLPI